MDPEFESCQDDESMDFAGHGDLDHRVIRCGPLKGCVMASKPRRAGSKGIRIYYHSPRYVQRWERTRESHNYYTGLEAVKAIKKDPYCKILAVGTEGGAMCLHYALR